MNARLDQLILDYQAGALDDHGLAELDAALRDDPEARARFAFWSRQAVALHEVSEATAERRVARDRPSRRLALDRARPRRRQWWLYAAGVAVAAGIAVAATLSFAGSSGPAPAPPAPAPAPVVVWTLLDDGLVIRGGHEQPAPKGTVLASGDEIAVSGPELRADAADGSRVRFAPGARARLGPDEIAVSQGMLRAAIAKRAADHPLRVVTPIATATIVGTAFALEAEGERTRLRVDEGRVRLARGVDSVEVGAGQACDAAKSGALTVADAYGRGAGWLFRNDLASGRPLGMEPATFIADARAPGQGAVRTGRVPSKNGLKQQRLALRHDYIDGAGAFTYDPDAVLHCTFRMLRAGKPAQKSSWELFMNCEAADHRSFRLYHKFDAKPDGDGWVTVELPLRALDRLGTEALVSLPGAICRSWTADSYFSDCDLDIAEFGVAQKPAPVPPNVQIRVQLQGLKGK